MEEGALLELQNLTVTFGVDHRRVQAVRGVDFTIKRGEIVALVGESGSGKSTIGHALMGLLRYDDNVSLSGSAMFHDKRGRTRDLLALPDRAMRALRGNDVAMIFQEPLSSLNPIFTTGSQITEAIRRHQRVSKKEAMARALELLEWLGLPNPRKCLTSYPHQISGGMRQRVMIAMALSCDPSLLIADEPTTALDVTIQAQIIDLLKRLQERTGMAILFVTHDLGLVAEIADRALVMYAGQIVETAKVGELFEAPRMPYTRALLDAIPSLGCSSTPDYELRAIPGNAPNPCGLPSGCAFHPRCGYGDKRCASQNPRLDRVGGDHLVRCVRWNELELGGMR